MQFIEIDKLEVSLTSAPVCRDLEKTGSPNEGQHKPPGLNALHMLIGWGTMKSMTNR
jgi:hypothetical protein